LVERLLCKQDVSGSSPLTSTSFCLFSLLTSLPIIETERTSATHLVIEQASLLEFIPARTLKTAYEQEIVR
jgi:hypothetical protein